MRALGAVVTDEVLEEMHDLGGIRGRIRVRVRVRAGVRVRATVRVRVRARVEVRVGLATRGTARPNPNPNPNPSPNPNRTRTPALALALAVDLGGVAQAVARGGLARRLRDDDAHAAEAAHDREGVLVRDVVADVHGEDVLGGSQGQG